MSELTGLDERTETAVALCNVLHQLITEFYERDVIDTSTVHPMLVDAEQVLLEFRSANPDVWLHVEPQLQSQFAYLASEANFFGSKVDWLTKRRKDG